MKYFFNCYTNEFSKNPRYSSTYVLNNHDKEGQFDGKGLLVVARAGDEVG